MNYTVYFDLETGGVEMTHPVIQLAAVAVDGSGKEASSFEQKIDFDVSKCDPEALKVNGFTPEAWKDAAKLGVAVTRFSAWIQPFCSVEMISKRTGRPYQVAKLAGYNAVGFDMPRLRALYGSEFLPCSYLVRDVLQRALYYFDERPGVKPPENFKLSTVCAYFDINVDGAHDALADARMASRLALRLSEEVW